MLKYFPNFNLVALVKVVESQFTLTTTNIIHREIRYDEAKGLLQIDYRNEFSDEDDALLFIREFINQNNIIEVEHKYCVLPKKSRNNGLIKPVFQESLQQYINIGAKRIFVHAGLNDGGYTWAKYGFAAIDKKEVETILNVAKYRLSNSDFQVVKKIYDFYYTKTPNGKSFPIDLWASLEYMKLILRGSDWHGELDLKNKKQFRNFMNYVSR